MILIENLQISNPSANIYFEWSKFVQTPKCFRNNIEAFKIDATLV